MNLQNDIIPADVCGTNCVNEATGLGAITVTECVHADLGRRTIFYYLFPDSAALGNGYNAFKKIANFRKTAECTTYGNFAVFIAELRVGLHQQHRK